MADLQKFSFLDDFEIPVITHENIKNELIKIGKTHSFKQGNSIDKVPLEQRLKYISDGVYKVLGRYKNYVRVIYSEDEFNDYIATAIGCGCLSLDTETNNSLDPLTCKIMGLCLYIPNTRPVYVPISHTTPGTEDLLENQVSIDCVRNAFLKLKENNTKIIYHNAKFDIRVCYNVTGVYLPIYWDTMIASQLLDENERAKLKYQYKVHVDPTIGTYNIEKLFTGIPYAWVSPEVFALYSAIDAYDTYLLQKKQQEIFEQAGMEKLYGLFKNIEIPVVLVVSKMEDDGISVDMDFIERLDKKFKDCREEASNEMYRILDDYSNDVKYYQRLGKLDDPVNFSSPQQLAIVLYDILRVQPPKRNNDNKHPEKGESDSRPTDKAALEKLKIPFSIALLKFRHYNKLITSYTSTLPEQISKKDGKIHASFNQLGKEDNNVVTGRFSSDSPNLQQLPSKETTMRMMFVASKGYCIVGGDYSQQEPRLLSHITQDKNLIDTYNKNRDLYATIGSFMFKKDYWECMEHWEDGSPNPDGKVIRSKCKQIILGKYNCPIKTA
jgi:DNA polymerase I-like protein with 3'-5' exonuclease and polymerase domains